MSNLIAILLWSFVINLGIACGAGLYETRISLPRWLTGSPEAGVRWNRAAAVEDDVGLRFWAFVSTFPLTLLTLASLIAPFWLTGPVHTWWLVAALAALLDRAMTFGYFIPTMIALMRSDGPSEPEAGRTALRWVRLGVLRQAATLIAWLAALKAFSLFYAVR
jgi:hypothetical protein